MQINIITRNKHYPYLLLLICILTLFKPAVSKAQFFETTNSKKRVTIPFRLVRNMVVVSLHINNKGPFNFVLDTGVGIMIITDPKLVDSINLAFKRTIKIYGLNGDSYEAYVTPVLKIDMPPDIESQGVSAAILKKDHFGLSNYAGMHIHGLLGYDFFNNLAVKFNFYDSTLTVSKSDDLKLFRKGYRIPITIEDRKPYMMANVKMPDGKILNSKLIIDLGAGHPLSLKNMLRTEGGLPQNFISANLGVGLTGPIKGFISRVNEIEIGKYKIKNVLTSFPDMDSVNKAEPTVQRDGNLGIGLLKRFSLIINYPDNAIYLKPGLGYRDPFEHDMTGMEYYFEGEDFDHLIVGRVEPGSSADNVNIHSGDEITAINFKPISKMTIEEIDSLFRSKDGRNLLLDIYRDKHYSKIILELKRRI